MKRRLVITAIFLLAGAVVNVAVAWGCALKTRVDFLYDEQGLFMITAEAPLEWFRSHPPISVDTEWKYVTPVSQVVGIGLELEAFRATSRPYEDRPRWIEMLSVHRTRAGWPLLAVGGEVYLQGEAMTGKTHGPWVEVVYEEGYASAIELPERYWRLYACRTRAVVPFRPIWPGFAANTLFYATILWLLIGGPFVLRRFIRVKRGLCTACAYPVGESGVCSECGKALPGRAEAVT